MKYQEAFDDVFEFNVYHREDNNGLVIIDGIVKTDSISLLQELVDKATPKKPTVLSYSEDFRLEKIISCNSCKKPVVNVWSYRTYKPNYCHYCGQAIDWSTDE